MSASLEQKAKLARSMYWARLGDAERALSDPSAESLAAWVITVDTIEKMAQKPVQAQDQKKDTRTALADREV